MTNNRYEQDIQCLTCKKTFNTKKTYYHKFCSLECAYLYRSIPQYKKFKKYLKKVSEQFLIWFAGFWEGEGSLFLRPNKRVYQLSVSQNDKNIFVYIQKQLRTGKIYSQMLKSKNIHYSYRLSNLGEVLALIERIFPYIKIQKRKKEAQKIINFKNSRKIKQYA